MTRAGLYSMIGFILITISIPALADRKGQATGQLGLEYGFSIPQAGLAETFAGGSSLRLRAFGGAKLKQQGLGAVGLGLDLSYTNYMLHDDLSGHYRRVVWDWFFLPLQIGFLELTPGFTWVITDVRLVEYGVRAVSIRPGGLLSLGFRLPILPHLAVTGQTRIERVWEDRARVGLASLPFETLIITGNYLAATLGLMAYF